MPAAPTAERGRATALLVTRNLPPLRGGMERLNLEMARALAAAGPLLVAGPAGSAARLPAGTQWRESPLSPLARFFASTLVASLRLAWRGRPRVVIAGSGLCAPFAWLAARVTGAHAAVYLHGLDIITDNAVYRHAWLPFIRRCDTCLTNSANTTRLAVAAGVDPARIRVVHPGVDVLGAGPAPRDVAGFVAERGWEGRRVLLSVGRLTERKGLLAFVTECLPALVATDPGILLAVIGNDAPDALRKGSINVRRSVEEQVARLGLSGHVMFMGEVSDAGLACAYAAADVAVFPVRTLRDDVEGFGMVAIEAASRGLPTVAFATGGVPDAVAEGVSGRLVEEGDYVAFAVAIRDVIADGREAWAQGCRSFAEGFSWAIFANRLRDALGCPP